MSSMTNTGMAATRSTEPRQRVLELGVARLDLEAELDEDRAEREVDLGLGEAAVGRDVLQHERRVDLARLLPLLLREVDAAEPGEGRDVARVDAERLLVRRERAGGLAARLEDAALALAELGDVLH